MSERGSKYSHRARPPGAGGMDWQDRGKKTFLQHQLSLEENKKGVGVGGRQKTQLSQIA